MLQSWIKLIVAFLVVLGLVGCKEDRGPRFLFNNLVGMTIPETAVIHHYQARSLRDSEHYFIVCFDSELELVEAVGSFAFDEARSDNRRIEIMQIVEGIATRTGAPNFELDRSDGEAYYGHSKMKNKYVRAVKLDNCLHIGAQ